MAEVGQSQSAISHHLALLRHTSLIEPRRDGARYYYSLTGVGQELAGLLQILMPSRPVFTRAAKARAKIGAVRRKDPGKTMHKFRRLTPASTASMIKSGKFWVIVLSDWSPRPDQELIERVQTIFGQPDQQALVPTVLILDDVGSATSESPSAFERLDQGGRTRSDAAFSRGDRNDPARSGRFRGNTACRDASAFGRDNRTIGFCAEFTRRVQGIREGRHAAIAWSTSKT